MFGLIYLLFLMTDVLPWLAPLAVSSLTGAGAGWGSFRFGQGRLTARVETLEQSSVQLVTRHELELIREDLREMSASVREVREGQREILLKLVGER
jgi:hypothetical protein